MTPHLSPTHAAYLLAGTVRCDVRTAARWLHGAKTHPIIAAALANAATQLNITPPAPAVGAAADLAASEPLAVSSFGKSVA